MWITIGVGILVVAQAGAAPYKTTATGAATGPGEVDLPTSDEPAPAVMSDTTVRFRNDVGDAFQMLEARFILDGHELPTVLTSVPRGQDVVIFDGQIAPGKHSLTSHVVYQGRSRSIFTYMKGYTFNLDSTHELDVAASGATSATIIGKPNKGFNVPFEKSLGVEMTQTSGSTGPSAKQVSTGFSSPGR